MIRTNISTLRVSLVLPAGDRSARLAQAVSHDPRMQLISQFSTLAEAYSPTEATPPDVVLSTRSIATSPEFPMYEALLDMLRAKLVVLPEDAGFGTFESALGLAPIEPRSQEVTGSSDGPQTIVAVGASTGGIDALTQILSGFPVDCPPTVVVQHIKPDFLDSVVTRLNHSCAPRIIAAQHNDRLRPGQVVFAPGLACHLEIEPKSLRCRLREGPPVAGHRPSVDCLFNSLVPRARDVVGVLLTGMGRDGAHGLGALRRAGARTLAQDKASSTVYGMPRVAAEEGAVDDIVSLKEMCRTILRAVKQKKVSLT